VEIDGARCNGCGLCVDVCPSVTLSLVDGRAAVTGSRCIACGHCQAICPPDAIRVGALDPAAATFRSVNVPDAWLPYGRGDAATLLQLMRSRRSCRRFREEPVDRAVLEDLVRAGRAAPSGTNSQCWAFTVLPTRAAVVRFGDYIGEYFKRLNRLAEKPALRGLLRLLGKPELGDYYRQHYPTVKRAMTAWDEQGVDRLFHGAPAVIIIATTPDGSTPAEDALLAAQNILLAAHTLGLGTCLIGFAVAAMHQDARIQRRLGLPPEEAVRAVIALGPTDRKFARCAGRKPATVRWMDEPSAG
jgi:nitroreductase/NAD-dependent dihydropyrimidine dehydrogenase PreA subunit